MKPCPRVQCKGVAVFDVDRRLRAPVRVQCSRCGATTARHRDPKAAERYWDEHGAVAIGPLNCRVPRVEGGA